MVELTIQEIREINSKNPLAKCKGYKCPEFWWFDDLYDSDYQWLCQWCYNGKVRHKTSE